MFDVFPCGLFPWIFLPEGLESGIEETAFVTKIDSGELARQAKELSCGVSDIAGSGFMAQLL